MAHAEEEALVNELVNRVASRLGVLAGGGAELAPVGRCGTSDESCNSCGHCASRKQDVIQEMLAYGATRVGNTLDGPKPDDSIAPLIDHTALKPDVTKDQLRKLCEEAMKWGFATVCVNAANIPFCARILHGSRVKPIAVVGFPLGAMTPTSKAYEAREAVRHGAREIDMVINIGAMKNKEYALVLADICAVVAASKPHPVKVILETSQLTRDEKVIVCALSKCAGAAFVKTSTGFAGGGATVEDIALMREVVGPEMGVKASGGVRDLEGARALVKAGANRIGASASVAIVTGQKSKSAY
jgi:deoxyribose-phosphate aldolase